MHDDSELEEEEMELEVPFNGEKKVKRFGPKIREWARRKPEHDAWLNILAGSVRSSKTWGTFPKILQLCSYDIPGLKVITGVQSRRFTRTS
jgi:hypothetical protein